MTATAQRWRHAHGELSLCRPLVMGILNVTPDSFSDGGRYLDAGLARARAEAMLAAGADVIDIGGESTRPGAAPVDADEELARVLPVVRALADPSRGPAAVVSIDTAKASVARAALDAGAAIVNDVTAWSDPAMAEVCASANAGRGAGVCLMHMQGTPRTMQQAPRYDDVVGCVAAFLRDAAARATAAGLDADAVAIDPGIGFGKTLAHNLALLRATPRLVAMGYPVLIGPSRKSFVKAALEAAAEAAGGGPYPAPQDDPEQRVWGTAAAVAHVVAAGAQIVRVHDVAAMRQVADLAAALRPAPVARPAELPVGAA